MENLTQKEMEYLKITVDETLDFELIDVDWEKVGDTEIIDVNATDEPDIYLATVKVGDEIYGVRAHRDKEWDRTNSPFWASVGMAHLYLYVDVYESDTYKHWFYPVENVVDGEKKAIAKLRDSHPHSSAKLVISEHDTGDFDYYYEIADYEINGNILRKTVCMEYLL